mmetsp:Transcript_24063/g.66948  ORF Transcript_24063/g.66948 Transcript_24063/m.66948 type:complete len:228 (-) Transcript_24063:101-784(-)
MAAGAMDAVGGDADAELPLPAMAVPEESLFDVTSETLDARLLFLGLDNAGKTTLLQMLKNDRMVAQVPTVHPQSEELVLDKVRFMAFDLAGHETGRRLWKDYFCGAGAVLFMVDAGDRTRFAEAAEELAHLLKEPALAAVPMAVLGQKVDVAGAASEDEFRTAMGVTPAATEGRFVQVFMCSVVERKGYGDAIRWISKILLDNRHLQVSEPTATAASATDSDEDLMV